MPREEPQWITVTDFTAGIISNNRIPDNPGITLDVPAAAEGTVRCIGLPFGGLTPLPARNLTLSAELPAVPLVAAVGSQYKPIGLWSVGPMWKFDGTSGSQDANFKDEIHAAFECITTSGGNFNETLIWGVIKAYQPSIPTPVVITRTGVNRGSAPNLDTHSRGMSWAITRARKTDFNYPGYPCVFTEWADSPPYNTGVYAWYVWPDPDIPGLPSNAPYLQAGTFDGNVTFPTTLLAHQGRIMLLLDAAFAHGSEGQFLGNEQFGVTDPPGNVYPTNFFRTPFNPNDSPIYSLDPEVPGGYGSWGSVSFGELMLFKKAGGALHVFGDLLGTNISVTRMQGVTSTGNLVNKASATPQGLVYCVENDGAYIWNGDNVSRKINKISDHFHTRVDGNPAYGVQVRHAPWADWVVFPNNWLYDSLTDSWWQLEDPDVWCGVMFGESMASTRLCYGLADSNNGQVNVFDRFQPASSYVYISQPFVVTNNLQVDINEVEVGITNNLSVYGKVTIQLEQQDGTFAPGTDFVFNQASDTVLRLRQPCSAQHVPHIRFKMTVEGDIAHDGPAPTVVEVRFGYTAAVMRAGAI